MRPKKIVTSHELPCTEIVKSKTIWRASALTIVYRCLDDHLAPVLRSRHVLGGSGSPRFRSRPNWVGFRSRLKNDSGPIRKILSFWALKSWSLLDNIYYKNCCEFMAKARTRLSFFACLKDRAGTANKNAALALSARPTKKLAPAAHSIYSRIVGHNFR